MSELPSGWSATHAIDLAEPIRGVTYKKEQSLGLQTIGYTAVLRANNIQKDKIDLSDLVYVPNTCISDKQRLRRNDIVIAMSSGSASVVGKSAQVMDDIDASFGAFCGALRPDTLIDARYLGHFLKSDAYRSGISELARGVNINNLKWSHFEEIEIPLAPLPEQKRIADKLDALLARIDACRDRLDHLPGIIKQFRQSVLAAATSGRLTEDWRSERQVVQSVDKGKLIQSGWTFERADQVCEKVQSGGTPKAGFVESAGVPFLKVYNLVNQKIDFNYRPQYVTQEVHTGPLSKSKTLPGDVLMNIVGPPLGKVAVVPSNFPEWNINQAICLFRPSKRLLSQWLYHFLCGGDCVASVVNDTRGIVGQVNISLSQCRGFEIPAPPLDEQHEIIRRVESLFAFANRLEERVNTARARVDTLTPATLAKAFRGELVPQDPNDEPASVLLERIRAERAAASAEAKPRSRRRSAS